MFIIPVIALPREFDSEVGGVLTRLLVPAASGESEESEEVLEAGDLGLNEAATGLGSGLFNFEAVCSERGAVADRPLGTLGALVLGLAIAMFEMLPALASRDICIWAATKLPLALLDPLPPRLLLVLPYPCRPALRLPGLDSG